MPLSHIPSINRVNSCTSNHSELLISTESKDDHSTLLLDQSWHTTCGSGHLSRKMTITKIDAPLVDGDHLYSTVSSIQSYNSVHSVYSFNEKENDEIVIEPIYNLEALVPVTAEFPVSGFDELELVYASSASIQSCCPKLGAISQSQPQLHQHSNSNMKSSVMYSEFSLDSKSPANYFIPTTPSKRLEPIDSNVSRIICELSPSDSQEFSTGNSGKLYHSKSVDFIAEIPLVGSKSSEGSLNKLTLRPSTASTERKLLALSSSLRDKGKTLLHSIKEKFNRKRESFKLTRNPISGSSTGSICSPGSPLRKNDKLFTSQGTWIASNASLAQLPASLPATTAIGSQKFSSMPLFSTTSSQNTLYRKTDVKETNFIGTRSDKPFPIPHKSQGSVQVCGRVNQYLMLKEIGSGSFGNVHLCLDEVKGVYVACKVISKSRLKKKFRFTGRGKAGETSGRPETTVSSGIDTVRNEVNILKKVSGHAHTSTLFEVLDDPNHDETFLVFGLCEFGSILKLKMGETVRPYSEELAHRFFRDIFLGLEFLHSQRIIHRDIKPDNLLLCANYCVKISDFGISHYFEEEHECLIPVKNASPLYAPPECCSDDAGLIDGYAADIWSAGVTLYALVHGRCPFEHYNIIALQMMIRQREVPYSLRLSPCLLNMLCQMMDKNSSGRITISGLRDHSWITKKGQSPLLSREENCPIPLTTATSSVFREPILRSRITFLRYAKRALRKLIRKTPHSTGGWNSWKRGKEASIDHSATTRE